MLRKRYQTRSSSLRKQASAILLYCASTFWKTFANRKYRPGDVLLAIDGGGYLYFRSKK